jgi:hypothetical protein
MSRLALSFCVVVLTRVALAAPMPRDPTNADCLQRWFQLESLEDQVAYWAGVALDLAEAGLPWQDAYNAALQAQNQIDSLSPDYLADCVH